MVYKINYTYKNIKKNEDITLCHWATRKQLH